MLLAELHLSKSQVQMYDSTSLKVLWFSDLDCEHPMASDPLAVHERITCSSPSTTMTERKYSEIALYLKNKTKHRYDNEIFCL